MSASLPSWSTRQDPARAPAAPGFSDFDPDLAEGVPKKCHRNVTARAGVSWRQPAHHRPNLAYLCATRRQLATPQWLCKQEVTGSIPVGSILPIPD